MPKISQEEQNKIKDIFQDQLQGNVNILFFEDDDNCEYCEDTREILKEISDLDDRIDLKTHKLGDDVANKYGIDRVPATIFVSDEGNDTGVHLYGIPSGYEFNTVIEDIIDMSKETPDLPADIIEKVKEIKEDVLLQVFVTPTCPYCPRAVRVAHQLAMVNPSIRGEMIEAIEFQELSNRHNVSGVPKTVINDGKAEQVGAVPVQAVLGKINEVLAQ